MDNFVLKNIISKNADRLAHLDSIKKEHSSYNDTRVYNDTQWNFVAL